MLFNIIPVSKADSQKHLDLHLNSKLSFDIHIKTILIKVNRTIGSTISTSITWTIFD